MEKENAQDILLKYQAGNCTDEEKALVEDWLLYGVTDDIDLNELEILEDLLIIRRRLNIDKPQTETIRLWPRIAAAASVILALSFGGYFILHKNHSQQITKIQPRDIGPGGNKAILTLANGTSIVLNSAKNGILAQQGNVLVNKTANGDVVYQAAKSGAGNDQNQNIYNTITTPRGGQYHLVLADGTNVWLNAASSIKYPTAFLGKDRRVEITGEAYFEVIHNAAKPFRVVGGGQTVEVLGTHFNINTYTDEDVVKTSLLEGSVMVSAANTAVMIKPGQQARLFAAGGKQKINVVNDADMDEAVAWKNGFFQFDNENLAGIMRNVSRWYDVDVYYKGNNLQGQLFSGRLSRFKNVSQLLKKLELTGAVHFKVEGKQIIVTN